MSQKNILTHFILFSNIFYLTIRTKFIIFAQRFVTKHLPFLFPPLLRNFITHCIYFGNSLNR